VRDNEMRTTGECPMILGIDARIRDFDLDRIRASALIFSTRLFFFCEDELPSEPEQCKSQIKEHFPDRWDSSRVF
jgi:hypothetical protein